MLMKHPCNVLSVRWSLKRVFPVKGVSAGFCPRLPAALLCTGDGERSTETDALKFERTPVNI